MTTTYCEDADVSNADPMATTLLPTADAGSFDRLRVLGKAEIDRRIQRRNPPVLPADLSDSSELLETEVRFVLHYLYRDAASRTGDDLLWAKSEYWQKAAEAELASVPLSVGDDDLQSVQGATAPVWRS